MVQRIGPVPEVPDNKNHTIYFHTMCGRKVRWLRGAFKRVGRLFFDRQLEREPRAFPLNASDAEMRAHDIAEELGDREPKTGARNAVLPRFHAIKALEDLVQVLRS